MTIPPSTIFAIKPGISTLELDKIAEKLKSFNQQFAEAKSILEALLIEEKENSNKSIAITDEPKFGQNVLTSQIQQFRSSVESGAQFAKVNLDKIIFLRLNI